MKVVEQLINSPGTYALACKVIASGHLSMYVPGLFDPVLFRPGEEFTITVESFVPAHGAIRIGVDRLAAP